MDFLLFMLDAVRFEFRLYLVAGRRPVSYMLMSQWKDDFRLKQHHIGSTESVHLGPVASLLGTITEPVSIGERAGF